MHLSVVYHSSDSFASIAGTSMVSLFENNKSFDEIDVYIIEKKISNINKQKLKKIADDYSRKVIFISMQDINASEGLGLVSVEKKWSYDGYNRLFLDHILPNELTKVLYLDSDVIVCSDLTELWMTDLNHMAAAAVMDCLSEKYYELFGLSHTARYCNSGVILFDLEQWREKRLGDRVKEYVKSQNGYVFFMEQSVLNVVLQDEIKILPPSYNVSTMMQILDYSELKKLRRFRRFYFEKEIEVAVSHPRIIHLTRTFLVANRPWVQNSTHPSKKLFYAYKRMTPWADDDLNEDKRQTKQKIVDKMVTVLPKDLVLCLASYLYNTVRVGKVKRAMGQLKN